MNLTNKNSFAKSVLITGVNGLLGSHVATILDKNGFKVFGTTRPGSKLQISNVELIELDLSSNWSPDILPQKIDLVLHFAQSQQFRNFPDGANDVFSVNVVSTQKLLEYARNSSVKHFIYTSTGGLYRNEKSQLNENSPINCVSKLGCYLGSKMCGEILTQNYSSFFYTSIIRPFFIYGRGQNRSMLIPRLYDKVKNSEQILLEGRDGLTINPIHVLDAAKTVLELILNPQSITFNMAGPQKISIREIADIVANYLGETAQYDFVEREPHDLIADISLMRKRFYEPKLLFANSLSDVRQ